MNTLFLIKMRQLNVLACVDFIFSQIISKEMTSSRSRLGTRSTRSRSISRRRRRSKKRSRSRSPEEEIQVPGTVLTGGATIRAIPPQVHEDCGPPLIMERAGLKEPGFWSAPKTDLKIPGCSNNASQQPGCLVLVLYPTDLAKLSAFGTSEVSINNHLKPMISMMALITMSSLCRKLGLFLIEGDSRLETCERAFP